MHAFSRQVADDLRKAYEHNDFDKLVIVASPAFLGCLRKHLDPQLESSISLQINKDLTLLRPAEIRAQLPYKLASTIEAG
jgi:protein required for attachment to host cells